MDVKHIRPLSPVVRAGSSRVGFKKRNALRGLSWGTYLLIILAVGRILSIVPILSSLPLVKVVLAYIGLALIAHWKLLPKVVTPDNPAVKWAIAFGAWIVLSIAFSIWPGSSRDFILIQLPILAALVLVICKLSVDWTSLRKFFFVQFVAAMILAGLGLLSYGGGRLHVHSMNDTNELAYMFDGVIPIALAFGMTATSRMRRLFFYSSVLIMALAGILTGSRGGLIGLLVVMAAIVLQPGTLRPQRPATRPARARKPKMGVKTRIVLSLVACALIGMAVWPHLPSETRERLSTISSLDSDYSVTNKYTGRVQIWKRGIGALADRPIGYGIRSYPMVDWRYGGHFYTAHNSLVLVLVELGPVGLVMYLAILWYLWRGLARVRRTLSELEAPSEQERQQAVFCRMAQVSLIGNFVAGEFLSATYYYGHWVNIALAMAFIAFFNREKLGQTRERRAVLET